MGNVIMKRSAFTSIVATTFLVVALTACGNNSSGTATSVQQKNADTTTTVAQDECAPGEACVVGDAGPGGGTVFYVATTLFACGARLTATCTYLEAAPSGWSIATATSKASGCATAGSATVDPRCVWSKNTTTLNAVVAQGIAIGTGYKNTLAIIKQDSLAGTAATASQAYRGGGKTDWYLPSKDELNQMYLNKLVLGGFGVAGYWSSFEQDASYAWAQGFNDGSKGISDVGGSLYVRPVRAF